MKNETTKLRSQFTIIDILLLMAGLSFAFAVVVPRAAPPSLAVAVLAAMALAGSTISHPIWRFCVTTRFTVCVVNHAGYLLLMLGFVATTNMTLKEEGPILVAGPMSLLGRAGPRYEVASIAFITCCIILLMSAHTFRRNLIGVMLTSLGTAMWYLAGMYGVLARGP